MGEEQCCLLCGQFAFGGFLGKGFYDLLVALEFVLDLFVSAQDALAPLQLEQLQLFGPQSRCVILCALDPPIYFSLDPLILLLQLPILVPLHQYPLLEVLQPLNQQPLPFLSVLQHVDLQFQSVKVLLLVDLHRDFLVDLLEGVDIALDLLAVFGESRQKVLELLFFGF